MSCDQSILDSVVSERTAWLVDVVTVITNSGGTVAAWVATVILAGALVLRGRRGDALSVAGAMLSGLAVMNVLKRVFRRDRPPFPERLVEASSYSFPSGHAMMTAIFACVVGAVILRLVVSRYVRVAAAATLLLHCLMVGLSRVYLAAHWMTDVLAGWIFGVLWAALWIVLVRALFRPSEQSLLGASAAAPGSPPLQREQPEAEDTDEDSGDTRR